MTRLRVGIVGLGLLGGSLARALTRAGHQVRGLDRDARPRRGAGRRVQRLDQLLDGDLIVLAAPPDANLQLLRRLAKQATAAAITDVGSVKDPICAEAERLGLAHFVGGHPIAGNAGSGFAASDPELFRGRPWITTGGSPRALRLVRRMARAAGARPVPMTASDHDRSLAFLSHLPQLLAWALEGAAQRDPVARRYLHLAGPGYAGMTRLAASPRPLWREILAQNRGPVRRAVQALRRALQDSAGG